MIFCMMLKCRNVLRVGNAIKVTVRFSVEHIDIGEKKCYDLENARW